MAFHLLSSRRAGAGAGPVPPTRLSRIAVVTVEAARQSPARVVQAVPALVAIAPQEALLAWRNAVALFEAAAFRKREAADWPLLWLGRPGPHLGLHEAEQPQAYVSAEALDDPRRQRPLLALKEARLPCRGAHHEPVQRGVVFERLPGCGEFKDADGAHEAHAGLG